MDNPEPRQPLGGLGRQHRRSIVGEQGAGDRALEQRLPEAVAEFLGALAQIPLQVAAQPRAVVEQPEQERITPLPVGPQHPDLAVMKVEVPQGVHLLALVTAHFSGREAQFGRLGPGTVHRAPSAAREQTVGLHEASHTAVAWTRAERRLLLHHHSQIVSVQLVTPLRMGAVLRGEFFRHRVRHRGEPAGVPADLPAQRPHRILFRLQGPVIPPLDGRDAKVHPLAAARMAPGLVGECPQPAVQLPTARRRGEQGTHHAEAQMRPALGGMNGNRGGKGGRIHAHGDLTVLVSASRGILCGPRPDPRLARCPARRPRGQKPQEPQQPIIPVAAEARPQRPRQRRLVGRRHQPRSRHPPKSARGKVLQPPPPPPLQRAPVHPQLFLQHAHPFRRQAVSQRRQHHHDKSGVDLAAQKAHRARRFPSPTLFPRTTETVAARFHAHPARLARIVRPMQRAPAMHTAFDPDLLRQIRIDFSQHRPQRRARVLIADHPFPVCLVHLSHSGRLRPCGATLRRGGNFGAAAASPGHPADHAI